MKINEQGHVKVLLSKT